MFERFRVGGAVEVALSDVRHFLQPRLVKMDGLILVKNVAKHVGDRLAGLGVEHWRRCDAVDPRPDRVEVDLQRLDRFRGRAGRDLPRVVLAVGQQHDHVALGTFVVQPVRRRCHPGSDRGPVFDHAGLNPLQVLQEPVVIQCHRADHVRAAGEGDNPDPVVRPAFDEFARHFADRFNSGRGFPSDLEVFRQHRLGNIEGEHDIDAARFHLGETFAELRPGHREGEQRQTQQHQGAQKVSGARRARFAERSQRRRGRKSQRRCRPALAAEPGEHGNREQQQQKPGLGERLRGAACKPIKQVQASLLSQTASLLRATIGCRGWSRRNART